jgi:hypothetical protein
VDEKSGNNIDGDYKPELGKSPQSTDVAVKEKAPTSTKIADLESQV